MKRRLFNILSAFLLLLCVATLVIWVRSYWVSDCLGWARTDGADWLMFSRGQVLVYRHSLLTGQAPKTTVPFWHNAERPDPFVPDRGLRVRYEGMGFGFIQGERPPSFYRYIFVPCWCLALSTAMLPYHWFRLYRRTRLARLKGHCPTCGYDLRASPVRCPECGTPVPAQPPSESRLA